MDSALAGTGVEPLSDEAPSGDAWGLAVDLSCGVKSVRSDRQAWMVANAGAYGGFLREWAQRGGSRPEPWRWEYPGG